MRKSSARNAVDPPRGSSLARIGAAVLRNLLCWSGVILFLYGAFLVVFAWWALGVPGGPLSEKLNWVAYQVPRGAAFSAIGWLLWWVSRQKLYGKLPRIVLGFLLRLFIAAVLVAIVYFTAQHIRDGYYGC